MVRPAHEQESGHAAERAREEHRADDDRLDVDSDVARGVFALADHRNLVAVLAERQVDEKNSRQERDENDVDQVFLPEDVRQPALVGVRVDVTHNARAVRRPD